LLSLAQGDIDARIREASQKSAILVQRK
jgi:hypothetical protein